MRDVLRDPALQEELLSVGYVKVPLLNSDELAGLASEMHRLHPDDGFAPDGNSVFNRSTYHCTFLDTNTDYKRQAQELISGLFQERIDSIAVNYRILTGNLYVKMPGVGRFQIHQNWPTTEDLSLTTLTVWCPLHDTDESNGTLRVVPGSHKLVQDIATPQRPPFFAGFEQELIDHHLVPVCLRAGEALFFDDSLVHWSSENYSESPRFAVQVEAVPREVPAVLYHLDESGPEPQWELYEVDGDFFVEHSIDQVIGCPTGLRRAAVAEFVNREMTEAEFVDLLARGPEIRRRVYSGDGWPTRA